MKEQEILLAVAVILVVYMLFNNSSSSPSEDECNCSAEHYTQENLDTCESTCNVSCDNTEEQDNTEDDESNLVEHMVNEGLDDQEHINIDKSNDDNDDSDDNSNDNESEEVETTLIETKLENEEDMNIGFIHTFTQQAGNTGGTVTTGYQELMEPTEPLRLMSGAQYLDCNCANQPSIYKYVFNNFDPLEPMALQDTASCGASGKSGKGCPGVVGVGVPNGIVPPTLEAAACTTGGLNGCLSASPIGLSKGWGCSSGLDDGVYAAGFINEV